MYFQGGGGMIQIRRLTGEERGAINEAAEQFARFYGVMAVLT